MKKEYLPLIISAAAVIALGVSLAALIFSEQPQSAPEVQDSSLPAPVLIDKNNYDIDKIKITTPQGSFTIRNMGALSFRVDELGAAPQDDDLLLSAAGAASSLTAVQTVSAGTEDLAVYGLESPRAIIQINYTDSDSVTLLLGDDAPGGAGRYALIQGSPAVYLLELDRTAVFLRPMQDYITLSLTAFPSYDQRITSMEISGGGRAEPLLLTPVYTEPQEDGQGELTGYSIKSPKERESSYPQAISVIKSVFGVTADSVAVHLPDAQALLAYGMTEPYAKISAALSGDENITLLASKPDAQGICYLMREGMPVIYRIQSSALPWLEVQYQDFLSPDMITSPASEIKTLTITTGEKTLTFRIVNSDDGMKVTLDGSDVAPQRFLQMFEKLLAIRGEEYTELSPKDDAKELASVRVTYADAQRKPDTLRFYDASARRIFISHGGITEFTCRKSALNELLDSAAALVEKEEPESNG